MRARRSRSRPKRPRRPLAPAHTRARTRAAPHAWPGPSLPGVAAARACAPGARWGRRAAWRRVCRQGTLPPAGVLCAAPAALRMRGMSPKRRCRAALARASFAPVSFRPRPANRKTQQQGRRRHCFRAPRVLQDCSRRAVPAPPHRLSSSLLQSATRPEPRTPLRLFLIRRLCNRRCALRRRAGRAARTARPRRRNAAAPIDGHTGGPKPCLINNRCISRSRNHKTSLYGRAQIQQPGNNTSEEAVGAQSGVWRRDPVLAAGVGPRVPEVVRRLDLLLTSAAAWRMRR